jgi:hypothetical protein
VPALGAVLLFVLAMGALIMSPIETRHLGNEVMAAALSASNIHFAFRSSTKLHSIRSRSMRVTDALSGKETHKSNRSRYHIG